MPKKFTKSHANKNKPGFRTSDFIKIKSFSGGPKMAPKFSQATFKTQHKG